MVVSTVQSKLEEGDFRAVIIHNSARRRNEIAVRNRNNKGPLPDRDNVILQEMEDGRTEVAVVDPEASMRAVESPELKPIADEVGSRLQRVISRL